MIRIIFCLVDLHAEVLNSPLPHTELRVHSINFFYCCTKKYLTNFDVTNGIEALHLFIIDFSCKLMKFTDFRTISEKKRTHSDLNIYLFFRQL